MKKSVLLHAAFGLVFALSFNVAQAAAKTYSENEFLDVFSGKTKKFLIERLGNPLRKEQSVKPANAGAVTGKDVSAKGQKPVKVEMWYYKNIVRYDPKRTYKETELTLVNDQVRNVAFFNNR